MQCVSFIFLKELNRETNIWFAEKNSCSIPLHAGFRMKMYQNFFFTSQLIFQIVGSGRKLADALSTTPHLHPAYASKSNNNNNIKTSNGVANKQSA